MKILKYFLTFIFLILAGYILYFYVAVYSKLIPAIIDSNVKKEKAFRLMDMQKEIINGTEIYDSIPRKKSSSVILYADKKPVTKDELKMAGFNNCRAIRWKGKTRITIGYNSGFSGGGYEIEYVLGRFKLQPYSFTDVVSENSKEPLYKIIKQEVTLDKINYKEGDSIYGKIDFIMENNDFAPKKIIIYGNGYFRTKLESL
ncbi:hypothetical protein [Chryseobacterium defluvii]|nr:hypothetical protein [Chryseobacterium defluvii]